MTAREVSELRDRIARARLEADRRDGMEALREAFAHDHIHSLWGYIHYRCRCRVCRAANTAHKARWRARRRERVAA